MDQKILTALIADTKRFFGFSQELKSALSRRINQSGKLKEFIDLSLQLCDKIMQKNDLALEATNTLRDQFNTISHVCSLLNININKQKELIGSLSALDAIDQKLEKRLMYKVLMLSESIQKGLSFVQSIIERNNEIILLDYRIGRHITMVTDQMKRFIDMGNRLQKSIAVDWKNYGARAVKTGAADDLADRVASFAESENATGFRKLAAQINEELGAEEALSGSIVPQLPLMDEISRAAINLYYDANAVRNQIDTKNAYNRESLEDMAQLSVILSLEIGDYVRVNDFMDPVKFMESSPNEISLIFKELIVLFDIAGNSIDNLIELNQYTVEIFDNNAKREDQAVELSNMFLRCYDNIRREAEDAAQSASLISEGAQKNIIIGQVLEKNLKKLMD
ncbi:MAG: hypothetical protein JW807_08025 [Spirochaetes bacterium]|nr:hypothetical protein [Spirochaetota bacterium]